MQNTCFSNEPVIDHLSLTVEQNEKFGLLGSSGSGKSLVFKALLNQVALNDGLIEISNKSIDSLDSSKFGYCPQNDTLLTDLTVGQMVEFILSIKNVSFETIDLILNCFDFSRFTCVQIKSLSKGLRRKLSFALAVMVKPDILLLDEPTCGMDPLSRRAVWNTLMHAEKNEDRYGVYYKETPFTVIVSTRYIEEAELICDRVGWLENGNWAILGNAQKIKEEYGIGHLLSIKFIAERAHSGKEITVIDKMDSFRGSEDSKLSCLAFAKDFDYLASFTFVDFINGEFKLLVDFHPSSKTEFLCQLLDDINQENTIIEHFSFDLENLGGVIKRKLE